MVKYNTNALLPINPPIGTGKGAYAKKQRVYPDKERHSEIECKNEKV